jgi:hypothetical protein
MNSFLLAYLMKREFRERERSYSRRRRDTREEVDRILVVCEGQQTEPNYFRAFRVPGLDLRVEGVGDNTVNLVLRADEIRQLETYDQVWCVFDRDSFPASRFNAAMQMAASRSIRVAYSNEAFELWYLLHFELLQSGVPRAEYIRMLTGRLGFTYEKNSRDIYSVLKPRQHAAVRNAKRLLTQYSPSNPSRDNPSTTVHLLVEELRRFAR